MSALDSNLAAVRQQAVHDWLNAFAAAVRDNDLSRGASLFDHDVVSFGTRVVHVQGVHNLAELQWKPVWDSTRGFEFATHTARIELGDEFAWVASEWHSQARSTGGEWFDRFGRATLMLRHRDGRWFAVHSHFSLRPDPARAVGRP